MQASRFQCGWKISCLYVESGEEDKRTSVTVNNSLYLAGSRMAEYQFNVDEDPENARRERESSNVFEPKECIGTPKRMMGTVLARQ